MNKKMKKCDMCGSFIKDGKCECGTWTNPDEEENNHFFKALEEFHKMEKFTCTADMPHLGVGCIYFRGGYKECKALEQFFYKINGRPYYE